MLLPDWKWILTKAWSVWAFYAVGLLSAVEVFLQFNGDSLSKTMPAGTYPFAVGLVSLLGIYLRTVAQKKAEQIVEDAQKEAEEVAK